MLAATHAMVVVTQGILRGRSVVLATTHPMVVVTQGILRGRSVVLATTDPMVVVTQGILRGRSVVLATTHAMVVVAQGILRGRSTIDTKGEQDVHIKPNCIGNCPVQPADQLKKKETGAMVMSNCSRVHPVSQAVRCPRAQRTRIPIQQPNAIKEYNNTQEKWIDWTNTWIDWTNVD